MLGNLSKRMKDQELVLRFWAFYSFDDHKTSHYKKQLALLLDEAMHEIKQNDAAYRNNIKKFTP